MSTSLPRSPARSPFAGSRTWSIAAAASNLSWSRTGGGRVHLADGKAGARRCDRPTFSDLHAGHRTGDPDDPEPGDGPHRPLVMAGQKPREPPDRQRQEDENGSCERRRCDHGSGCGNRARRVPDEGDGGRQVSPVGHQVERSAENPKNPGRGSSQRSARRAAHQRRPPRFVSPWTDKRGPGPSRPDPRAGCGETRRASDDRPGSEPTAQTTRVPGPARWPPRDARRPPCRQEADLRARITLVPQAVRQGTDHACGYSRSGDYGRYGGYGTSDGYGTSGGYGEPVAPQPPHVPAERLGQQRKRDGQSGVRQRAGHDASCSDRQDDSPRRGHHLAPVARRRSSAHPVQPPAGHGERIAGRADREHPLADRAGP